jgi:hypothetical protein
MKVRVEIEFDSEKDGVKMAQVLDAIKDNPIAWRHCGTATGRWTKPIIDMEEYSEIENTVEEYLAGGVEEFTEPPAAAPAVTIVPEPETVVIVEGMTGQSEDAIGSTSAGVELRLTSSGPGGVQNVPNEEPKPEPTRKRRSRAEIEADDDKICRGVIEAAFREYREPTPDDLPADVRKRVGKNYVSWTDPQWVKDLRDELWPVATEAPAVAAAKEAPPEPANDFSDLLSPADPATEAQMRFEISDKIFKIAALDKEAARELIKKWGAKVPEYPREQLPEILADVERTLDEAKQ